QFCDTPDRSRDERLEAAMSSPDLLQQDWIGISRNRGQPLDNEPHLHPAPLDPERNVSEDVSNNSTQSHKGAVDHGIASPYSVKATLAAVSVQRSRASENIRSLSMYS